MYALSCHTLSLRKSDPCCISSMYAPDVCKLALLRGVISTACRSTQSWCSAINRTSSEAFCYSTGTLFEHNLPTGSLTTMHKSATKAVFVKSSVQLDQMPAPTKPEVALIGHSNVGKSSLINLLTGQQNLAKVSKQPGKTKCINHFLINSKFYLVDCPGYGYARVSKKDRLMWHELTQLYMLQRQSLAHVMLLVDAMQVPNKLDIDAAIWLHQHQVPYTLVFTKVDLSTCSNDDNDLIDPSERSILLTASHTVNTFLNALRQIHWQLDRGSHSVRNRASILDTAGGAVGYPYYIISSSKTGIGKDVLLAYMHSLSQSFAVPIMFQ